ncbi:MAG: hypothetical protein ACOX30_10185, partial [Dethiobacteria bacterium]
KYLPIFKKIKIGCQCPLGAKASIYEQVRSKKDLAPILQLSEIGGRDSSSAGCIDSILKTATTRRKDEQSVSTVSGGQQQSVPRGQGKGDP